MIKSSGVFDWKATKEDPFTIELHDEARKLLKQEIKANIGRVIEIIVLFTLAMSQLYLFVKGEWYTIVTLPLTYWIFSVNVFHDASHFALSYNWLVNSWGLEVGFFFNTPYIWYY